MVRVCGNSVLFLGIGSDESVGAVLERVSAPDASSSRDAKAAPPKCSRASAPTPPRSVWSLDGRSRRPPSRRCRTVWRASARMAGAPVDGSRHRGQDQASGRLRTPPPRTSPPAGPGGGARRGATSTQYSRRLHHPRRAASAARRGASPANRRPAARRPVARRWREPDGTDPDASEGPRRGNVETSRPSSEAPSRSFSAKPPSAWTALALLPLGGFARATLRNLQPPARAPRGADCADPRLRVFRARRPVRSPESPGGTGAA